MSITDTTTNTPTLAELVRATGLPSDAPIRVVMPGLTVRSRNCLLREGIRTIGQLVTKTDFDLLDIRNFGIACLDNVRTVLAQVSGWPAWRKEIADLAGALNDGYDASQINDVLARLSDLPPVPGFLACVWELRDEYGYGGDSQLYLEADSGGLWDISGDLWSWLSHEPGTPGAPASPGDPATWKGGPAGFELGGLAVDDDRHNFARTAR